VRLLLLTGQRREEVGAMTWSEIDARVPGKVLWSLSGKRTKRTGAGISCRCSRRR
jgi:integrase